MFRKTQKIPKAPDIKIEIIVKPNRLTWKSNVSIPNTIFYLDRTKFLINQDMDKINTEAVEKK